MDILNLNLDKIKPYEKNPRKNDEAVKYVAESIKEFGFRVPIVIDSDYTIIAGHTRYKAAKKLNLETVPCIKADDLTEQQVKAFRLADNKVGERSEWDMELLDEELAGIFDLDMSLFDFDLDIEPPSVEEDDYEAELPEEPKAKLGDIYQLGRHRLMCGDSTLSSDVLHLTGGVLMDMMVTDPPYNVALGMGGSVDEARKRHRRTDGLVIMNDKMEDEDFRKFLRSVFEVAKNALKPGGAFYIWHADNEGYNFRGACRDVGLTVRQCLIWEKNSITLGRQDYQWIHEPCLYGWSEGASHFWNSDRKQSTIIKCDRPTKSEIHPTMKPIELFDYQIRNSSKVGENVLDLFNGSGTTIMACEGNGRNAYCMELDPRYVDAAIARWEEKTGEKAVLLENVKRETEEGNKSGEI